MENVLYGITIEELKKVVSEAVANAVEPLINKKTSENTDLLTRKEAASILKISLPTIDEWTKQGVIKAYRIGKSKRYKKDEILMSEKLVKVYKYRRNSL